VRREGERERETRGRVRTERQGERNRESPRTKLTSCFLSQLLKTIESSETAKTLKHVSAADVLPSGVSEEATRKDLATAAAAAAMSKRIQDDAKGISPPSSASPSPATPSSSVPLSPASPSAPSSAPLSPATPSTPSTPSFAPMTPTRALSSANDAAWKSSSSSRRGKKGRQPDPIVVHFASTAPAAAVSSPAPTTTPQVNGKHTASPSSSSGQNTAAATAVASAVSSPAPATVLTPANGPPLQLTPVSSVSSSSAAPSSPVPSKPIESAVPVPPQFSYKSALTKCKEETQRQREKRHKKGERRKREKERNNE
jgi:hypothetical protein